MSVEQYREQFDFMLNQLVTFCSQLTKAQKDMFRTKPGTQERETAELDLNSSKESLRNSFNDIQSIINNCNQAWELREPPERDMEKFWGDFQNQVMSKYVDIALPYDCKLLQAYIDSH